MINKKGNITQIFTLIVAIAILIITTVYLVNMLAPFIWYQKLQNIADKYVYVVERFGYLTVSEKEELYQELAKEGFDISCITIECPSKKMVYGQKFEFNITYKLTLEHGVLNGINASESKIVWLHIKKHGYSKV